MSMLSISVVLTHFNKGELLQRTIDSLQHETPELIEIIVVDDASTDPSWNSFSVELENKYPKVKIIRNLTNLGPANRLNQGANAASGDYLFFMDADDVLAPNRLNQIITLMAQYSCDLFYGNKIKVHALSESNNYPNLITHTIEQPLTYMIEHNIMEMCVMCSKEVWLRSQGCNPRLFIQDESLALQLGLAAQKLLFTETPCVFVILDETETKTKRNNNRLSRNLNQQHHDMFFTIDDFMKGYAINKIQQKLLKKKALSTYWKSLKVNHNTSLTEFFWYLAAKINPEKIWLLRANYLESYFSQLKNVRHPH